MAKKTQVKDDKTSKKNLTKKSKVKEASVKKAAAKKTSPGTKKTSVKKNVTAYVQSAEEKKLVKELTGILPQLDEEGLLFLIEQARVHLYNMQVTSLQEELNEIEQKRAKAGLEQRVKQKNSGFKIERSSDGTVYHIISGGKWKLVNADEMFHILRIVNAPVDENEVRLNLIHWFFTERGDFVGDFGLADSHDPRWVELIKILKKNFKLKI